MTERAAPKGHIRGRSHIFQLKIRISAQEWGFSRAFDDWNPWAADREKLVVKLFEVARLNTKIFSH